MRNGTACILVSILLLGTVIYILGSGKGRVIENKKDKHVRMGMDFLTKRTMPFGNRKLRAGFGQNTRCFSCETDMPDGKEWKSRPTKCFSCENTKI